MTVVRVYSCPIIYSLHHCSSWNVADLWRLPFGAVAAYNLGGKTLPFYRGFLVSILELYHHSQKVTDI